MRSRRNIKRLTGHCGLSESLLSGNFCVVLLRSGACFDIALLDTVTYSDLRRMTMRWIDAI